MAKRKRELKAETQRRRDGERREEERRRPTPAL